MTEAFFSSLPGLFPTPPRSPAVEGFNQLRSDSSRGHQIDPNNSAYELRHKLHRINLHELEAQQEIPEEYRHSYRPDGLLPSRVIQLRPASSHSESTAGLSFTEQGSKADLSFISKDSDIFGERPSLTTTSARNLQLSRPRDFEEVDWDGPNDPENPMNWSSRKKITAVVLASVITFVTPLGSSMFAPGVPQLMAEFGSSNALLSSFVVSVYLAGFVLGPFVIAPAAEIVGRVPCYHVGNVLFVCFSIACALSTNIGMFIAFRLLMGAAGATPLTIGGATIADVIAREIRGKAMAAWAIGPLVGPVLGPVIGGFLVQAKGWRWVFWLLAIVSGFLTLLGFAFLRETYGPKVLQRKTERLRKETGNQRYRSKLDHGLSPRENFRKAIVRPLKLLTRSPIVILLSLNVSIVFSYLYVLFTTFTYVFEQSYGFNSGEAGLAYLGMGIGMIVGLPLVGRSSDTIVKKLTAKNGGIFKPEYRLRALVFGPTLVACGLFGYGWSAEYRIHWIAPILLTMPVGLGLIATFLPTTTYMVDAFGQFSASAIAAQTIMRSLFAAALPLAGQTLYSKLGLGWGNSLLGFIALCTVPVPFLLIRYGERIRMRFAVDL